MSDLPVIITQAGLQPTAPATLKAGLLASVAAVVPGYTANLPASLIEDVSSTDVGALVIIDSAYVDTVNSLTPFGANEFLLNELGTQCYGVARGTGSNTSVFEVFSGTPGFVIAQGFVVSDGTHQYIAQDGGIVGADGVSPQLFFLATVAGSWAVPAGSVNQIITSVPSTISLSVTNPETGTPGATEQSTTEYRAQVLQAGRAASVGMATYLKTLLGNVAGVQPRLVAVRMITGGGWEILVGGGDPYEVAYAIYSALFDVSTLTGSVLSVSGITKANPGVVTTVLNHGYVTGQTVTINGSNPTNYNGTHVATVLSEKTFSIATNTTSFPNYIGNAYMTPNARNIVVSVTDYPDIYPIPYVNPPQQTVAVDVTWNTSATNFVSEAAVASLGAPAIANYINSIQVGQPIILYLLQTTFQEAIAAVVPPFLLTRMVFEVSINGVGVDPEAGTGIIAGDPESYFLTTSTAITVTQG